MRRGAWIGIALMVLAVVVGAAGTAYFLRSMTADATTFAADGQPHRLDLPAGERFGVFLREGATGVDCTATDADGGDVTFGGVSGEYTVGGWEARESFDTGSGDLTFTCQPVAAAAEEVRVGPLPSIGVTVAAMLASCGLGLLLFVGGLVLLVVSLLRRDRPA